MPKFRMPFTRKTTYIEEKPISNATNETSFETSPYNQDSYLKPYNPDLFYQQKGNYQDYDTMRIDDQVKAVLNVKKNLIVASGFEFIETNTEDYDEKLILEIKSFIEGCFYESIEKSFEESLYEMLTCLDYGFSCTEKVFKVEDGKFKLKWLKTRYPDTFIFYTDKQGNLLKDGIRQRTDAGEIPLDHRKFMLFMYQQEFDNKYGTSDLIAAYKPWWSKNFIIKCWNIYLERFGMPTAVGKYPSGTSNKTDMQRLQQVLKNIQAKTSITVPDNLVIEFLEATRNGNAGYEAAIDKYNLQIARSIGIPDLMGFGGSKTSGGSFALGSIQVDIALMAIERIRKQLERIINLELLQPLIRYNFNVDSIPLIFKFKPISENKKFENIKLWAETMKNLSIKPTPEQIDWLNETMGAPEGDNELKEAPSPMMPGQEPDKKEMPNNTPADEEKKDVKEDEDEAKEKKEFVKTEMRAPIMAEKKVKSYTQRVEDLDNIQDNAEQDLARQIRIIGEALIEDVEKKRIVENKRLDKVNDLKLKHTKQLQLATKSTMGDMFKYGTQTAKEEISATKKEYIELDQEDALTQILNNEAILVSTMITDSLLNEAKIVLSNGIKSGLSTREVVKQLKQMLEPWDPKYNGARLTNVVRTSYATVYNDARMSYYKPLQDDGFIASYQYSAIMDDRTTAFCASMDGKIFRADEVGNIEPPNHYMCRSELVPITINEIENKEIFGATEEQNKEFFPNDKFKPSTMPGGFEEKPGGFWVKG